MAKQYPRAKYHASLAPVLVQNADEEKALGEGWFDHPSLMDNPIFLENGHVFDAEAEQFSAPAPEVRATPQKAQPKRDVVKQTIDIVAGVVGPTFGTK